LPIQPGAGSGAIGFLESISGDHTLRVWHSGTSLRVSDILPAAERSIYARKDSLWIWDSQTFTAHHVAAPSQTAMTNTGQAGSVSSESPPAFDPESMAKRALSAIEPSTTVSLGPNADVAGRDCYTLILEPNTSQTLVGRVEINVDAETKVPLRVAVYARGAETPALSGQFTSVSYDAIDPSVFDFTPPAGAKVVQVSTPHMEPTEPSAAGGSESMPDPADLQKNVRVIGTGWSTVVAVRVPPLAELKKQFGGEISSFIPYSGPLVSATIVDRGDHAWILAGAVPQSALARVEPELT
jgi:outer membrane lipoprotein-sorting protein